MKYRAFINFTHNGVRIKGGEVFDNDVVKFSVEDINFLKEQSKIELVPISSELKQTVENVEPSVADNYKAVDESFSEESELSVAEEETEVVPEEKESLEVDEQLPWEESDDLVTVEIKESNLTKLSKAKLVELAEKLNIDTNGKTKKQLAVEIAEINT